MRVLDINVPSYHNMVGALVQWLPLLVHRVVQLSTEHPLLSALYRLTTCLLRVSGDAFATINSRTDDAAPNVDLIPDEANGNGDGPGAVAAQGPTQKVCGCDVCAWFSTFVYISGSFHTTMLLCTCALTCTHNVLLVLYRTHLLWPPRRYCAHTCWPSSNA